MATVQPRREAWTVTGRPPPTTDPRDAPPTAHARRTPRSWHTSTAGRPGCCPVGTGRNGFGTGVVWRRAVPADGSGAGGHQRRHQRAPGSSSRSPCAACGSATPPSWWRPRFLDRGGAAAVCATCPSAWLQVAVGRRCSRGLAIPVSCPPPPRLPTRHGGACGRDRGLQRHRRAGHGHLLCATGGPGALRGHHAAGVHVHGRSLPASKLVAGVHFALPVPGARGSGGPRVNGSWPGLRLGHGWPATCPRRLRRTGHDVRLRGRRRRAGPRTITRRPPDPAHARLLETGERL
ncbi:hypothetical protein QJS66_11245 [Kocuria rhizophila]|nr:hypothetical protein QJS66_11245 [Kocuria rhizophila]